MLSQIGFVFVNLNDGLTGKEILRYAYFNDEIELQFISFCIQFGIENKFLRAVNGDDRYTLTLTGKEFVSSQFGKLQSQGLQPPGSNWEQAMAVETRKSTTDFEFEASMLIT